MSQYTYLTLCQSSNATYSPRSSRTKMTRPTGGSLSFSRDTPTPLHPGEPGARYRSSENSDDRRTKRKEGAQQGSSWWWKYKARRVAGLSQFVSGTYAFKVRVLEADKLVLDLSIERCLSGRPRALFLPLGFFLFQKWCRENSRAYRSNARIRFSSFPPPLIIPSSIETDEWDTPG